MPGTVVNINAVLPLLAEQFLPLGAKTPVFLFDGVEGGDAPHNEKQQQCHQKPRRYPAKIDPDIHHRGGAARDAELDGLIHERGGQTAQQRPAHMADKVFCVNAQAEHEEKTLQQKLGKVGQFAHRMLGERAEMNLGQQGVDFLHHRLAAGCGDCTLLQRVVKDKQDTDDQCDGEYDSEYDQPGAGFLFSYFHKTLFSIRRFPINGPQSGGAGLGNLCLIISPLSRDSKAPCLPESRKAGGRGLQNYWMKASWMAATALSASALSMMTLILISLVEIIWMLIFWL